MEFKTGLKNFLNEHGKNEIEKSTLRGFLSGAPEEIFINGYIGIEESINDKLIDEVLDLLPILDEYIKKYWTEVNIDYHHNSTSGCYFLSTLFALSSSWNLVQGNSYYKNKGHIFYHSWLEKDDVVFDPAMRVITTKEKYDLFFDGKDTYNTKEAEELFKKTSTFTHYREDLENGTINPILYLGFYGSKKAKQMAEKTLKQLNEFMELKKCDILLDDMCFYFKDENITDIIKKVSLNISKSISEIEGISISEALKKFKSSDLYYEFKNPNNTIWSEETSKLVQIYYDDLREKKY